jgi:hypothetical protein
VTSAGSRSATVERPIAKPTTITRPRTATVSSRREVT